MRGVFLLDLLFCVHSHLASPTLLPSPYRTSVAMAEVTARKDGITIRGVRVSDGDNGLWEVYAQLTTAPPLSTEILGKLIAELDGDAKRELVVAIDDVSGKVIGTSSLILERKLLRGGALCAHIEDVVVCSSARGRGVGKRLVKHLVEVARERHSYKVILDCSQDNVPFYERCGFAKKELQMALYF